MAKTHSKQPATSALGDYAFQNTSFSDLDKVFKELSSEEFKKQPARKRFEKVNETLLQLILDAPKQAFLLPAVVEFIGRVNHHQLLKDRYHISHFEFWLNQFSGLNAQDNQEVRGKIAGRYIPRDEYQAYFPIGMDKVFSGTHFVAAHLSPDVDTMVASFWGWVDAFATRVGDARHIWSLPGGPPDSPVVKTFQELFGATVFNDISSTSGALTLSAIDLVTQTGFVKRKGSARLSTLELSTADKAVVLIDEEGCYLGDWHSSDLEIIRKIIIRFKSCLRWFENNFHIKLITLFSKEKLHVKDISPLLASIFDLPISECEPAREFTDRQKKDLNNFLHKVIGLKAGLQSTFGELAEALSQMSVGGLSAFRSQVDALQRTELFDQQGHLRENRPELFKQVQKIFDQLDRTIHQVCDYAEQLDVAIEIKNKVLGMAPVVITMRSDIDEIRIKMQKQDFLTVVIPEEGNKLFPLGIVWGTTLQKQILGTVSFRDFCNQEEVRMASYLTPISVIDHHKSSLTTSSPPSALISDAQSCNVLIAEQTCGLNARYSLGGMESEEIEREIDKLRHTPHTPTNMRLLQRLLQRRLAANNNNKYWVHPAREFAEYLCCLHAILDDTDLLTKVSKRDVECVVELLNRIKSLTIKQDVEVVNLDDISRDKNFAKNAAKRILHNPDMYSLYRKVFVCKEQEIESMLSACSEAQYDNLFVDTKEQNGCCRVGQTKLFSINISTFLKAQNALLEYWLKKAQAVNQSKPEIDLHMHMMSTIASADEVYEDKVGHYNHKDEMWFWVPPTQKANDHLASFLASFQAGQKLGNTAHIEFLAGLPEDVQGVFTRNCPGVPSKRLTTGPKLPIAILRFGAGLLNSRKAMITPYLPRLLS